MRRARLPARPVTIGRRPPMDDLAGYLGLALAPGIGPVRLRTLLTACQTPDGAYMAPFAFLCSLPGFSRAAATAIRAARRAHGQQALDAAHRLGATVLAPGDPRFPPALQQIPDPPPVLFAVGRLALLAAPSLAIVGSRDHSSYGAEVCRELSAFAARSGLAVVSGMARGLDAVAHEAALDAGGASIGVLGNGLGVVYPAANRALYERMHEAGLLLSEFPPGERPHAGSFPRRNRLISGLARVVVVIEAAFGSGALITADAALEQGKDVAAVPGNITSRLSAGTNRLIRDGATPLLEPGDLAAWYPECPRVSGGPAIGTDSMPLPADLTPAQRDVASHLSASPLDADQLAGAAARPVAEVLAVLSALEILGVARHEAGRRFCRAAAGR